MSSHNTLTRMEFHDEEVLGIRAHLRKPFFQKRDKAVDQNNLDAPVMEPNKISLSESADSSSGVSKPSPRFTAEVEFRAAAKKLHIAMSNSSRQYQVPEVFQLQTVDHVNDVEATCHKLETAIDKLIDIRTVNIEAGRQVWKECVKRWYCALFPYVRPCLSAVSVNTLYES